LELAAEKDRGFDPDVFAAMTGNFTRLRRDEFAIDDRRYEQLARLVGVWRQRALEAARNSPGHERSGPDLGIDH
jgi:hypothetical protein